MDVSQWKTVPFADALVVPYLTKAAAGTSAGAEPAAQLSAFAVGLSSCITTRREFESYGNCDLPGYCSTSLVTQDAVKCKL
ncbi:hypothetical protein ANCDUO_04436 [Ancylostoma duodenale]|uniref:Uncharacterized protein n=1 Tax=Ancylostoma duodenale TaxID=51022 RepID=A0A0C2H705_9BILA|nr:hypothetical protein ANCDUO_04436 [Ancylostoma duodenale]